MLQTPGGCRPSMNSPGPHFLPGKRSQPFGSVSLRPFGPLAPTSPAPCSLLFSTQAPSLQAQGHCGPQQRLIRFLILPSCPWLPGAQGQEKQCGGLGVAAEISPLVRAGWGVSGCWPMAAALSGKVLRGCEVSGVWGGRPPPAHPSCRWWHGIIEACVCGTLSPGFPLWLWCHCLL